MSEDPWSDEPASGRGLPRSLPHGGWPGWDRIPSVMWIKVIEGADLSARTKAVALVLAANWQVKKEITHPGVTRMAAATQSSVRTVLYSLAELEGMGLIFCTERGSKGGRSGKASVYLLTAHARISEFALPGFSMPYLKEIEKKLAEQKAS